MAKCKWCHRPEINAEGHPVIFCTICLPKGNKAYKALVAALNDRKIDPQ